MNEAKAIKTMNELIKTHGDVAVEQMTLCQAAKYIYGKMYPVLCEQTPSLIWVIAGFSEGRYNSRNRFIAVK